MFIRALAYLFGKHTARPHINTTNTNSTSDVIDFQPIQSGPDDCVFKWRTSASETSGAGRKKKKKTKQEHNKQAVCF